MNRIIMKQTFPTLKLNLSFIHCPSIPSVPLSPLSLYPLCLSPSLSLSLSLSLSVLSILSGCQLWKCYSIGWTDRHVVLIQMHPNALCSTLGTRLCPLSTHTHTPTLTHTCHLCHLVKMQTHLLALCKRGVCLTVNVCLSGHKESSCAIQSSSSSSNAAFDLVKHSFWPRLCLWPWLVYLCLLAKDLMKTGHQQ